MPGYARIVDTAMVLRAESPQGWEAFVAAIRDYAAMSTADMMKCPPDMLLRAQGWALCANDISSILQSAPKLKDKIIHERSNQTGQTSYP